jgi:hypothetical protein
MTERKIIAIPERIHHLMLNHLKWLENHDGLKVSINSWVAQAIREKIDSDHLVKPKWDQL